jgi:hypothetical protein
MALSHQAGLRCEHEEVPDGMRFDHEAGRSLIEMDEPLAGREADRQHSVDSAGTATVNRITASSIDRAPATPRNSSTC